MNSDAWRCPENYDGYKFSLGNIRNQDEKHLVFYFFTDTNHGEGVAAF
jgi:hypothetical protein